MNKPIKPKKPSKNDFAPQEFIDTNKWVVEKDKKIFLIDENSEYIDQKSGYPNLEKLDEDGFEMIHSEEYKFSFLEKIYRLIGEDFSFGNSLDSDGYVMGLIVTYKVKNKKFGEECIRHNKRFENYEKQLKIYEQELNKYQENKKQEKLDKLKEEINKLEKV